MKENKLVKIFLKWPFSAKLFIFFFKNLYFFKYILFSYFTAPGLSCSTQALQSLRQYVGSSSPTRDQTQAPCIGAQNLSHWPRPPGKSLRSLFYFLRNPFLVFSHTLVLCVIKSVSSAAFLRSVQGRSDSHQCWAHKPAGF